MVLWMRNNFGGDFVMVVIIWCGSRKIGKKRLEVVILIMNMFVVFFIVFDLKKMSIRRLFLSREISVMVFNISVVMVDFVVVFMVIMYFDVLFILSLEIWMLKLKWCLWNFLMFFILWKCLEF